MNKVPVFYQRGKSRGKDDGKRENLRQKVV